MATFQAPPMNDGPLNQFFPSASPASAGLLEKTNTFSHISAPLLVMAERAADCATVTGAICLANAIYVLLGLGKRVQHPPFTVATAAAGFGVLFVVLLEHHGAYRSSVSLLAIRETERILRVTAEGFVAAMLFAYFSITPVSRLLIFLCVLLVPIFLVLEKWQSHRLFRAVCQRRYRSRRTIIVGAGAVGQRISSALGRSPKLGLDVVAFVDNDPEKQGSAISESRYPRDSGVQVLPGPVCPELLQQIQASVLVIADSSMDRAELLTLCGQASEMGLSIYFVPPEFLESHYWIDYTELDGTLLAHFGGQPSQSLNPLSKRLLDLAIVSIILVPWAGVCALIGLAVKLTSRGGALFRQVRIGQNGQPFVMYKFRTMVAQAPEYSCSPQSGDDPRITPLGRWLRHSSLDELPQLINVLKGEMSLVGPRPEMPFIVQQYTPWQRQRLTVKPGITGLWQIGPDRSRPIHENLDYDFYYARQRSMWMDLSILLHTLFFAPKGI